MLNDAVDAIKAAVKVFKSPSSSNLHGFALAKFQLGLLLETHPEALSFELSYKGNV